MRKVNLIYSILLTCFSLTVQAQTMTDGPYVFYRGDQVVVKSVFDRQADSTRFLQKDKSLHPLTVHVDGHPEWDFKVQLKTEDRPRQPEFKAAAQTLVLSDIEGEFEPFRNLLLAAKVIDTRYNWIFGTGRLVIAGDLFDRGKQVSPFLWLLYKLEDEARAKGGDVNVVLGNHDIMNLDGDFRYVQPEYLADAQLMGESYAQLYAADTELGRWLRSKNEIEKIGDLLVLHGGISPAVLERKMSLAAINASCRPYFAVSPRNVPDSLKLFFSAEALFWYRGYFVEPKASQELIDQTLSFYGCQKIIVGHDIIDHVAASYQNKVIGVDVNEHEGTHEGLLIEGDHYYRIDDHGNRTAL